MVGRKIRQHILSLPRSRGSSRSSLLTATWRFPTSEELQTERKDQVVTSKLQAELFEGSRNWWSIKGAERLTPTRNWGSDWAVHPKEVSWVHLCWRQASTKEDHSTINEFPDIFGKILCNSISSCTFLRVHLYIDEDVKGAEGNHTNMDIDESDPRSDVAIKDNLHGLDKESVTPEMYPCRKEVLKDISSLQNRVDLVFPVSESADIGQSAAMFEIVKVRLSPPLEMQTSRYKCLTRSRVSTECKDSERINQDQFRTSSEFKHALVKKRSSETLSETNEDNIHKHFKNSSVTLNDVNLSTAVSVRFWTKETA